jgi:CelD/BcsL family acetyltransferase involved in cellulose biosynthesis
MTALADAWNDLWDRSPTVGLFQSFEYCIDAWESVARPAGRSLACLAGWRDGRLVAVWPLVVVRHRLWTYARPLGASGVELHEMLLDDTVDAQAWVRQASRALLAHARVDVLDVSFFQDSATAPALRDLPSSAVETSEAVSVSVGLRAERDWDAYYTSLSRSYRKDFAKSRRRLEALGPVEFAVLAPGDPRTSALVGWTLAQKRRWAERTGKNGDWLYSDDYRAFLERQVGRRGNSVENVVLTMTVNGDLMATQIGASSKDTFEAVIAGFNADYEKYSPGARLTEAMIRWAWERGVDCDLGAGAEPYKLFWSRNRTRTITIRRMAVSRWGRAALAVDRARQRLK